VAQNNQQFERLKQKYQEWNRVVLLTVGILLPSSVQADAVTFITSIGADFQHASGTVAGLSEGLGLGGYSDSGGHFLFSNPLAPMVGLAAHEGVETGPLVAHTDTSWTFHGGGVVAESDGEGATIIPLPTGYATCEAAGFITSDIGACIITPFPSGVAAHLRERSFRGRSAMRPATRAHVWRWCSQ
jgi:hypothetical protein